MIISEHNDVSGARKPGAVAMVFLAPPVPSAGLSPATDYRKVGTAVLGCMAGNGAPIPGTRKLVEVLTAADAQDGLQAMERLSALSPREVDVLACIAASKASKVIAGDLGISPKTVEIHRAQIMRKTRSKSVFDLGQLWAAAQAAAKRTAG